MALGERLKLLIEEKGLDQKEFGKIFNLSPSTVSGYITGYRTPSDDLKIKFADYFNVSVDWLLGRTNIRNPYNQKTFNTIDVSELPEEMIQQVKDYVEFLKQKYKNRE